MSDESRKAERHEVRFKLVYDDGNTFNAGVVADVSEGGVFLETALPLPIGTVVQITPLDPAGDELFEVQAKVVRTIDYDATTGQQAGMGLQFVDLNDEERSKVVGLINSLKTRASEFEGEKDPFLGVMMPSQPPEPAGSSDPEDQQT